jgi:hypothetical protein
MSHLSPERIAALVDEPATESESAHLAACGQCRADFVATRRIVAAAAAERTRPVTPLLPWQRVAAALREEGVLPAAPRALVATPPASLPSVVPQRAEVIELASYAPRRVRPAWVRNAGMAAAAALLVTAGVAGGRWSAAPGSGTLAATTTAAPPLTAVSPATGATPVAQFRSADDARLTLQSAEAVYSNALLWLAAHDSALAPRVVGGSAAAAASYRQRLEVLDAAMATAQRALHEAPDDPVMNRYYLATLGAREVTLRRLTTVLPASEQVVEY